MHVISRQPPLVTTRNGGEEDNHPRYYTTTLYNTNGKLKDDLLHDPDNQKSYWESFVDEKQARELERRLEIVEQADYIPGMLDWPEMEDMIGDNSEAERED